MQNAEASTGRKPYTPLAPRTRRVILAAVVVLVAIAMVLGTKIVPDGSQAAQAKDEGTFDQATFGPETFPTVQKDVSANAVDAKTLAATIAKDPDAAAEEYGVKAATGTVFSVTVTGTAGAPEGGAVELTKTDAGKDTTIRVQMGPAINGTDLRDATGKIQFGDFTNQIDYQNAGAALNAEMKKQVLADVDPKQVKGKKVTVTGAFTMINPKMWQITPVSVEVS